MLSLCDWRVNPHMVIGPEVVMAESLPCPCCVSTDLLIIQEVPTVASPGHVNLGGHLLGMATRLKLLSRTCLLPVYIHPMGSLQIACYETDRKISCKLVNIFCDRN